MENLDKHLNDLADWKESAYKVKVAIDMIKRKDQFNLAQMLLQA